VELRRFFLSVLVAIVLVEPGGCGNTDSGGGGTGAATTSNRCPTDEPPGFSSCDGFAVGLKCSFPGPPAVACRCELMDTSYFWYCAPEVGDGGLEGGPPDASLDAPAD
jgi:hypothetical protein